MTSRPSFASESRPCWKSSPPTCSYTTSTPRPSVARMTSATTSWVWWLIPTSSPSSFARSSFSSEPALPITNAPASFASCTAADPIPLPTELISTVSPGWSFARVKSMCQAVAKAIWVAAAVLVRELVRDADQLASRAGELLGVPARGGEADEAGREAEGLTPRLAVAALAARAHQIGHHPLADLPAVDPVAEGRDAPDDLDPEDEGRRDVEPRHALADVDVEVVERADRDVDQHLAGGRLQGRPPPRASVRPAPRTRERRLPASATSVVGRSVARLCQTFGRESSPSLADRT